jgi:hypothetical protein
MWIKGDGSHLCFRNMESSDGRRTEISVIGRANSESSSEGGALTIVALVVRGFSLGETNTVRPSVGHVP